MTDDRGALAYDPQQWLAVRIVGITSVLPVPAQTAGRGGVWAEHAPIERLYPALVLRPVPIDFGHGCERVSSLGAPVGLYRDGGLSSPCGGRVRVAAALHGRRRRRQTRCAVPTGTLNGSSVLPHPAYLARGLLCATGRHQRRRKRCVGPRVHRWDGTRPAAAAAAIAGSSIWSAAVDCSGSIRERAQEHSDAVASSFRLAHPG